MSVLPGRVEQADLDVGAGERVMPAMVVRGVTTPPAVGLVMTTAGRASRSVTAGPAAELSLEKR